MKVNLLQYFYLFSGACVVPACKIIISCHQPCHIPQGEAFLAVEGGRALARGDGPARRWLRANALGDDSGENISRKNRRYNELTVIYWAWKNFQKLGNPDYIGFMHYRRFFIFDQWKNADWRLGVFPTRAKGTDLDERIGAANAQKIIDGADLCYACYDDRRNVREQYAAGRAHRPEDLAACLAIIDRQSPDYSQAARAYLAGKRQYFCNMFIMRRQIFNEYCQWIFPILQAFDAGRDYSRLSPEEARFFVSERLTGIFVSKKLADGASGRPLAVAFLEEPEPAPAPAFGQSAAVAFGLDDASFPCFSIALLSLLGHASPDRSYEIFVLHESLAARYRQIALQICAGRHNVLLRFLDMRGLISPRATQSLRPLLPKDQASLAKFYPFFLGQAFPDWKKMLWLHCDVLVQDDVGELFDENLDQAWLGAVPELGARARQNCSPAGSGQQPDCGFQTGVLLCDLRKFREQKLEERLLAKCGESAVRELAAHAALNAICQGQIRPLPLRWNIPWLAGEDAPDPARDLPMPQAAALRHALKRPGIVHYSSALKPWNSVGWPLADLWWRQAAESPFREFFLALLAQSLPEPPVPPSLARRLAHVLLPGSLKHWLKQRLGLN